MRAWKCARTGLVVRWSELCDGAEQAAHLWPADLVAKGAVLRKGERLRSRFCKFVKSEFSILFWPSVSLADGLSDGIDPRDSIFAAQLYVSDTEELYR